MCLFSSSSSLPTQSAPLKVPCEHRQLPHHPWHFPQIFQLHFTNKDPEPVVTALFCPCGAMLWWIFISPVLAIPGVSPAEEARYHGQIFACQEGPLGLQLPVPPWEFHGGHWLEHEKRKGFAQRAHTWIDCCTYHQYKSYNLLKTISSTLCNRNHRYPHCVTVTIDICRNTIL